MLESVTVVISEGGEDRVLVCETGEEGEVGVKVKLGGMAVEFTFQFS